MNVLLLITLVVFILLISFLLIRKEDKSYEITPKQALKLLKKNYFQFVVDVRTPEEFREGHLNGSINIPIGILVNVLPEIIPDKDAKILFLCKRGIRSAGVVEMAKRLGYKNVKSMKGNWSQLVYPN